MTTRAGRPFLYIHVFGLREIILPLSDGGRTDVSAWVSDRHGVCPYMQPIGRVQGDADIFKSNQSYSLFLTRIKNRFVMQLRRLGRAWDS